MMRQIFTLLGVLTMSGIVVVAQQKPRIEQGPIGYTGTDARIMFDTYCAVCHGKTAKGDGPAAPALKRAPADLTKITARNGGAFPTEKVVRFIAGSDEVQAHGNRDMPVWGTLFRALEPSSRATADLRVHNLTEYLRSIQQ